MNFVFVIHSTMKAIIQSIFLKYKCWLPAISSLLTVMLFVYTGFSKLWGHDLLLRQLKENNFLKIIAEPLSVLLPVAEILAAVFISIKSTALYGWYMAAGLMTLFTIYIIVMLLTESKLPCTCGGVVAALSWKQHLFFNITFLILSVTSLYYYKFLHVYKEAS